MSIVRISVLGSMRHGGTAAMFEGLECVSVCMTASRSGLPGKFRLLLKLYLSIIELK